MKLNLLVTNDFHSSHDGRLTKVEGEEKRVGGSARLANLITQERELAHKNDEALLLLDAGDMFLGSEFFTFFDGEVEMKLYEKLKYDAMALGNHDFDQGGLPNLLKQHGAHYPEFPILSCNLFKTSEKGTKTQPFSSYKIFTFGNGSSKIKVSVIGVLGDTAFAAIAPDYKSSLLYKDQIQHAIDAATRSREVEGADCVICLSHSGEERGDMVLAESGAFDVVFSGHQHFNDLRDWRMIEVKSDSDNVAKKSVPLHPGNSHGRAVQKISFNINAGQVLVDGCATIVLDEKYATSQSSLAEEVCEMLDVYRARMRHTAEEVIAHCHNDRYTRAHLIHSHQFCAHGVSPLTELALDALFSLYNRSITGNCPEISKQIQRHRVLSAVNLGGVRSGLTQGTVTVGKLLSVFPFDHAIHLTQMSGVELQRLLKRNEERAAQKKGELPGMGYHLKWMESKDQGEFTSDMEMHLLQDTFYVLSCDYVRTNDITDVLDSPENIISWEITPKDLGNDGKHYGLRKALVDFVRQKKALH